MTDSNVIFERMKQAPLPSQGAGSDQQKINALNYIAFNLWRIAEALEKANEEKK